MSTTTNADFILGAAWDGCKSIRPLSRSSSGRKVWDGSKSKQGLQAVGSYMAASPLNRRVASHPRDLTSGCAAESHVMIRTEGGRIRDPRIAQKDKPTEIDAGESGGALRSRGPGEVVCCQVLVSCTPNSY